MATYETRLRETSRFVAIDADGTVHVVVEHLASLHRVSLRARPFEPVDGGNRYHLIDGRELVRKSEGRFETVDGTVRLSALDAGDTQPSDAIDAPSDARCPSAAQCAKGQPD